MYQTDVLKLNVDDDDDDDEPKSRTLFSEERVAYVSELYNMLNHFFSGGLHKNA